MTSHRDENDLTDDEVLAMWDEGEPVELVAPATRLPRLGSDRLKPVSRAEASCCHSLI